MWLPLHLLQQPFGPRISEFRKWALDPQNENESEGDTKELDIHDGAPKAVGRKHGFGSTMIQA